MRFSGAFNMKKILLLIFILNFYTFSALDCFCETNKTSETPAISESKLLKIVVLSRHGVRVPTQHKKILEMWSQKPWPEWPVKRGFLTPRGAALVTAMWQNLYDYIGKTGLLPKGMCPPPGSVYVRADVDQRTKATAIAILNGIGYNCKIGYAALDAEVDPLFHPVKAGLFHFNPISAATDVLAKTEGGLDSLQSKLSPQMQTIGAIMGPLSPELCKRFAMLPDCELSDLPNDIMVSSDGNNIELRGALDIASSMTEIFLLEYAEWPDIAAGWGQVNLNVLQQILPVHAKVFDVVNRAPIVAWAKGSALLRDITAVLSDSHPDKDINGAKLVIYVGHDTNLANIGELLNLNWHPAGYAPNENPPAGALFFELWETNGQRQVVLRFYAQTPNILHKKISQSSITINPEFAPSPVSISSPPIVGEAKFPIEVFNRITAEVTEGAPILPFNNPPLNFSRKFPD